MLGLAICHLINFRREKTNFSIVAKQHLLLTTLCQRVLRGRLGGKEQ